MSLPHLSTTRTSLLLSSLHLYLTLLYQDATKSHVDLENVRSQLTAALRERDEALRSRRTDTVSQLEGGEGGEENHCFGMVTHLPSLCHSSQKKQLPPFVASYHLHKQHMSAILLFPFATCLFKSLSFDSVRSPSRNGAAAVRELAGQFQNQGFGNVLT